MEPLELLAEPAALPSFPLPPDLSRLYPGTLGFPDDCLYANFVETLDGTVALGGLPGSNKLIADASEQDQFVMAMLRACADVVLVGSGTLTASPRARWVPEAAYPDGAAAFAELRSALGLEPMPAVAVITTGAGLLALDAPLARDPIVLTTAVGGPTLRAALPDADVVTLGATGLVDVRSAVAALRERGYRRILCEGGPTLFGSLLEAGLVDELFLTLSPLLAGRPSGALGLVEETTLLPDRRVSGSLAGVRRGGDHVFLRYRFR